MGANALNSLREDNDNKSLGANFSYIAKYDDKNPIFHGVLDIGRHKKISQDIDTDLIAPDKLKKHLSEHNNALLISGLGGSTGATALLSAVHTLKKTSINMVCAVYFPFDFEGIERKFRAQEAYENLKKIDAVKIVSFNNQDLIKASNGKETFRDAFILADKALKKLVTWQENSTFLNNMPKHAIWDFKTDSSLRSE